MATMQYELIEKYGACNRSDFPYGKEADEYWDDFVKGLMSEAEFYDYELERHTKYRPKGIADPDEVFSFMEKLEPNRNNLFLFNRRI